MMREPAPGAPEDHSESGEVSRVQVALRVIGDDLNPTDVSRLLGVAPTFAARRGEARGRRGRVVIQPTGVWSHSLTPEASPEWTLADALDALLARFPADPEPWRALGARYKLDVFCGLFLGRENQGADVRPSTLAALGVRGLTLDLDIYGPFSGAPAA